VKTTARDWLKVLVLLLDEAAVVALLLLALWFFHVPIPLSVAIVLALLLGVLIFIIHRAVIPSFRARQVTGREGMIGLEGKVIEPLAPKGVVRIEGEYWRAKSVDGDIAAGENVEVVGLNKLILEVRHKGRSSKS
jgi:membrane-bound serine protease (ClpP class)